MFHGSIVQFVHLLGNGNRCCEGVQVCIAEVEQRLRSLLQSLRSSIHDLYLCLRRACDDFSFLLLPRNYVCVRLCQLLLLIILLCGDSLRSHLSQGVLSCCHLGLQLGKLSSSICKRPYPPRRFELFDLVCEERG